MLTLSQVFGSNAFQNGQTLIINKSGLPLLIASHNNSSGALLVAIALKTLENFQGQITDDFGNTITDDFGNSIEYDNQNLYEFLNCFRWEDKVIQRGDLLVVRKTIVIESFEYAED